MRAKRVFERCRIIQIGIAVFAGREPFVLGPPINVGLWSPDIAAAKAEAEGFQAHGFVGHVTGKDDQVSPAKCIAVFLFDRPQQAARLIKACVVGPRIERCETDVAMACATATVLQPVRPGRVPSEADHQPAIVAPVRWPPVLIVCHQGFDVGLYRVVVQRLGSGAVVIIRVHRVCARTVLVQNVEVQRLGPPFGDGFVHASVATVCDRAAASCFWVISVHDHAPFDWGWRWFSRVGIMTLIE